LPFAAPARHAAGNWRRALMHGCGSGWKLAAWPAAMLWLPEPSLLALALACAGAFWLLLPRAVPASLRCAVLRCCAR
jgi:hypothetical protein